MYKQKYLKYKQKYLELKGGASFEDLDFNSLSLDVLKRYASKRELTFNEKSTKNDLVMLLNSYREQQKRKRESGGGGSELDNLVRERSKEFERRFGAHHLDNISVSEKEIEEAKIMYGDEPNEILKSRVIADKRQPLRRAIESDPDYLKLLTCQIRTTKPVSEEYQDYNHESLSYKFENGIRSVFTEREWYVANARGDGRCMIHSIIHGIRDILGINSLEINEPFEVIVFKAFKKYFAKTDIGELYFKINTIYRTDSDVELEKKIRLILNRDDIEDELFFVLAIYFNINILQISYDHIQHHIFRFQQVSGLSNDNCIIIINHSGHYKLIYNKNKETTKNKINEILRKPDSVEIENGKGLKLISGHWYIDNDASAGGGGGGYDLAQERALREQRETFEGFDDDTLSSILQSYRINNLSNAPRETKINAIMTYIQEHPESL